MSSSVKRRLPEILDSISSDLNRTVSFWLDHSIDKIHGGFFQCLDPKGEVYDTTKYCWLLSRQVWILARLYNNVPRFSTSSIKKAAIQGAEFVMKYVQSSDSKKCYFSLTQDGQAIKTQRTIFSECFYIMAMSEMFTLMKEERYKTEALSTMSQVVHWVREDATGLGRPFPHPVPYSSLAVPMMLLCLIDQLESMDPDLKSDYSELAQWCTERVMKHTQRNKTVVLENVTEDGQELPGSMGRLMCPGHAIESGWFLLKRAMSSSIGELNDSVVSTSIETFIMKSFEAGWDKVHGGLYYFLDVDGKPPVQLEWDMKLWWCHNEAMIASLMAYKYTKENRFLEMFERTFDYCSDHFVDKTNGEWFGYLSREGNVKNHAKGGPWKGCFHIPRSLMMCEQLLKDIIADGE